MLHTRAIKRPIVAYLENRQEEDIFHTFYRINDRFAIDSSARKGGFEIESVNLTAPFGSFVFQGAASNRRVARPQTAYLSAVQRLREDFRGDVGPANSGRGLILAPARHAVQSFVRLSRALRPRASARLNWPADRIECEVLDQHLKKKGDIL